LTTYADPPPPTRARPRPRRREPEPTPPTRKDPLWAKLCIILGAVVMVVSGGFVVVPRLATSWLTSGIQQVEANASTPYRPDNFSHETLQCVGGSDDEARPPR